MNGSWGNTWPRRLLAGLALLWAAGAGPLSGAEAGNEVIACGSAAPPPLRLAWREAPEADSVATLAGSSAYLRVENALRVGVFARVDVTLTTRDEAVRRRLPDVWIEPGRTAYLPVSLEADAGLRPQATAWAAASAAAVPAQGRALGRAGAPVLYFHEEGGVLHVYGEDALRTRFAGGVLPAGVRRPAAVPAGSTLEMALDGRAGAPLAALETFDETAATQREQAQAELTTRNGGR
jgi:hypothetical protein